MSGALPDGRAGRLLAAGLALLLLAALWMAIAQPLIGWYAGRAEALSQRAALLRQQLALAAQLPAIEQAARRADGAATAKDTFLAGATDAIAGATLEQSVQAMASGAGATLASAETLPPQADGRYQRIRLRVTVTSGWGGTIALLQAITAGPPVMLVDDLQLAGIQAVQAGPPAINAVFTVIAFRDGAGHPAQPEAGASAVTAP